MNWRTPCIFFNFVSFWILSNLGLICQKTTFKDLFLKICRVFQIGIYSFEEIIGYQNLFKKMFKSAIGQKKLSFSVITKLWLGEHLAFVVECFIKTESYVAVQRTFCEKFKEKKYDLVPSYVTISKWVKTFRRTSAATSDVVVGRKRSVQMVENCENCEQQSRWHNELHFIDTLLHYISHSVRETDLMSKNKFSRYLLLKLEMPFLRPNW